MTAAKIEDPADSNRAALAALAGLVRALNAAMEHVPPHTREIIAEAAQLDVRRMQAALGGGDG